MRQLQLVGRFEDIKKGDRLVIFGCPMKTCTGSHRATAEELKNEPFTHWLTSHEDRGPGRLPPRHVENRKVFRIIDVASADSSDVTDAPVSRKLERAR